jgi:hypothetical protein
LGAGAEFFASAGGERRTRNGRKAATNPPHRRFMIPACVGKSWVDKVPPDLKELR